MSLFNKRSRKALPIKILSKEAAEDLQLAEQQDFNFWVAFHDEFRELIIASLSIAGGISAAGIIQNLFSIGRDWLCVSVAPLSEMIVNIFSLIVVVAIMVPVVNSWSPIKVEPLD